MSLRVERWNQDAVPVARELREVLQGEGYTVSEWTDASGTVYPPHSHSEDQSHWIISGELEIRVHDQTYKLGTGDRDFLPANTMHAAFVPGDEPVRYLIGAKHR
ncbi:MAG: cupin domain-containing protein [Pyrinomonadaceae bacterium]|nr:cupin domain-containing protein [Pyrinomonadaceae bacterium]